MDNLLRDSHPSLPVPRSSLIGREAQIAGACALLTEANVPLLTMVGPGGVGKTRLALATLHTRAATFDGLIAFVDLAPVADPGTVVSTVARAIAVRETADRPLIEQLVAALRPRPALLLIDNCEHLLPAVTEVVTSLLTACPLLQVVTTSREPLHIQGEQEFPVDPLPVPPEHGRAATELAENAAVRLFCDRTRAVDPTFQLTAGNAAAIAGICRRLDGLPLAIELVAARGKLFSPEALLARLERRLPLLSGGRRDAPARLRTMRGAITWSHDLSTPEEQALFRRLAVFVGGWTLAGAEAVGNLPDGEPIDVFNVQSSLVDKSIVQRARQGDGEPRFLMLETVREFAGELLEESGEAGQVRRQHAAWLVALAERSEPELVGKHQVAWLERLESEHDNVRAALAWTLEQGEEELSLRLFGALIRFWRWHGPLREARDWGERIVTGATPVRTAIRAKALVALGVLVNMQPDPERATTLFHGALSIYRELDDQPSIIRCNYQLGEAALGRGEHAAAQGYLMEAAATARASAPIYVVMSLKTLGYIARLDGDLDSAIALLEEALAVSEEIGFVWGGAEAATYLADVARERHDIPRAAELQARALDLYLDLGDLIGVGLCVAGMATIAAASGQPRSAARLLGAAARIREAAGHQPRTGEDPHRDRLERTLPAQLGEQEFAAANEAGRLFAHDAVIAEALAVAAAVAPVGVKQRQPVTPGLTRKEREVLCLVAEGLSNPQIADRLFVSRRTVTTHIEHIFAKLDVRSRTEAAVLAQSHGLC